MSFDPTVGEMEMKPANDPMEFEKDFNTTVPFKRGMNWAMRANRKKCHEKSESKYAGKYKVPVAMISCMFECGATGYV